MPHRSGKISDQISRAASEKSAEEPSMDGRRYRNRTSTQRRKERRDRLLLAALEAFADRGYVNTSIEQLCVSAAISTRNFYEEFARKEELLFVLYDEVNQRALAAAEAATNAAPLDLAVRAQVGVRAYLHTITADPRLARISYVESVGVSVDMERHRRASHRAFAELIARQAQDLIAAARAPARDFSLTAIALVGAIKELGAATVTAEDRVDIDQAAAEAARLIIAALGIPAAGESSGDLADEVTPG
ncbi:MULTISPECIES: TetR/AcrR family transcriptional regulator [unclassified Lysobacter]|uniref:TetR/AcrR family transcriptional regulator n=1 Tax=unclassified Lysobacter TaxID=2635362 RepID=UPI001BEC74EA|nr:MULTISPECIES: TetR/AcrR family transcriptional regulator [unclassified Lysobacter]MBT2748763.1 TetR/AcrR family transcriptional regulator [Lysobacter sp. ISL-42]MBT2751698.1 TetR/AcrR family transcriptional regulator [Lysobacter sp. ISL-50]MBT2775892.1 TetR/AcrR family transcriptional regulator [Lysobacter sp. ISL-54]MBT2782144.1 TetR/AcrR family transcriptional regulator [Lysobacter sp. ISL-52]